MTSSDGWEGILGLAGFLTAHRRDGHGTAGVATGFRSASRRRPGLHHTSTPRPSRPVTVAARPSPSTRVVRYSRWTSRSVGSSTMRFGVARHGPSAPEASQFGKYDVFTRTGTPGLDTRNETEW